MKVTRRGFLLASGAAALCSLLLGKLPGFRRASRPIPGAIHGASSALGHRLRSGDFPPATVTLRKRAVIIGGGISGLAAGYRLAQAGLDDFMLLDPEERPGGNSISGHNEVSAYPWGAHYVPVVTEQASAVKRLFEEFGIITGHDSRGLPVYNEFYVCADPEERLYMYGRWQEGLVPVLGIAPDEEAQYERFFKIMGDYRTRKGRDGKKVFAIPIDKSSQDREWLALDAITMREWMQDQGFDAPGLQWYANYCCRDDYGTTYEETSAWAGIHYFAARNGVAANMEPGKVVTWPEGNGWLAQKLAAPIHEKIATRTLAYSIIDRGDRVVVEYWDEPKQRAVRVEAEAVVIAVPRFVAQRLLHSDRLTLDAESFTYSPWMVANITLGRLPSGEGAPLSWDNVIYDSETLGYVVATHQITQMRPTRTVLTYYWPLSHLNPEQARREAVDRSYHDWQKIILRELLAVHPELEGNIERVDVWLWGHAMIRPVPGFIWGAARRRALEQHPPVFTAHSDMSGISIFEEAYTRGAGVAEQVLDYLRIPYRSVL
jgi:predicted NAD/FAD-binding protein